MAVKAVVGVRTSGGIREEASYRLNRNLAAGAIARLQTDFGPMGVNTARRYAAVVSEARIAE